MAEKYISQVTIPDGSTYKIKDSSAWNKIGDLYSIITQGALELVVVTSLGTASADTMGKLYLTLHNAHDPSQNDIYDEYVTVDKGTSANPRYVWEKIGNTDVNLSNYAQLSHTHGVTFTVPSHTYTPSGSVSKPDFTGNSLTSSGSFTPSGSVTISSSTNRTANVSPASGTATYTPKGTVSQPTFTGNAATLNISGSVTGSVSGSTGSGSAHSHSIGKTTSYLHTTSVVKAGGLSATTVLKNVSTLKLSTATGYMVGSTTATASKLDTSTGVTVAKKGTDVSVPRITANSSGTVTVTCASAATATGALGNEQTTQGASTPMWNAKVDANETLYFTFKPLSTANRVTSATASTTATKTTYTSFNVSPVSGTETVFNHTFTSVDVPIKNSTATTYATGGTASNGSGSTVAVANGSTADAYTGVKADGSVNAFTSINSTSTGGTAVITAVDANTGSESAHTHSVSLSVSSGSFSSTVSYTPSGTVSQPTFDGSATRLVTGNINVPTGFTFSGSAGTVSVTGTPSGSVSKPTFSGNSATLTHTEVSVNTTTANQ